MPSPSVIALFSVFADARFKDKTTEFSIVKDGPNFILTAILSQDEYDAITLPVPSITDYPLLALDVISAEIVFNNGIQQSIDIDAIKALFLEQFEGSLYQAIQAGSSTFGLNSKDQNFFVNVDNFTKIYPNVPSTYGFEKILKLKIKISGVVGADVLPVSDLGGIFGGSGGSNPKGIKNTPLGSKAKMPTKV
jgi:hypothetical protein